jgi:hypothetical protein
MSEYHKIQTVYMRDPATNHKTLLEGQYSLPEFAWLAGNEWVFTEKVDGTNIRIISDGAGSLHFGGKTDAAQIPAKLVGRLRERFPDSARMSEVFGETTAVVLYGEGYGAGIQKGGVYRPDQDFVLFDVRVGNWWLQREDVEDVAEKLGLDVVPVIGRGTLADMVDLARGGFPSLWNENTTAEGIVARPATELCTRRGDRLITKIKHSDFGRMIPKVALATTVTPETSTGTR